MCWRDRWWWAPPAIYSKKALSLTIILEGHTSYTTGTTCPLGHHNEGFRVPSRPSRIRAPTHKRKECACKRERRPWRLCSPARTTACRDRPAPALRPSQKFFKRVLVLGSSSTCAPADERKTGCAALMHIFA